MSWKVVLVGAVIAVLLWAGGLWTREEPKLELTILHTNDVHSHFASPAASDPSGLGGSARLATLISAAAKARHVSSSMRGTSSRAVSCSPSAAPTSSLRS
jgi:2',3'-cyclic-nucleotide 2'-phosphodiesterase (5'-nucleotidase family)